ncbi:MAG: TIGR00282 family metallophosphoesterase [Dehalococcoidia bacterium]|nr:TIGR00282 family metallophosphoesterase [Dehalococcoidia bacterium]
MKILGIGDIIGKPGRDAVQALLPELKDYYGLDFIVANGENTAGGIGITPAIADDLFTCGVDVITSGNHVWAQKEIYEYLDGPCPVIRPLNYPPEVSGRGYVVQGGTAVVNLIGRTYMNAYDCPFRAMDKLLGELPRDVKVIVVDFHAEATSEKVAMGHYLDGRVSAVLGTHTHVATADAQVFPNGMAYVTDIGMVGPKNSVIGGNVQSVVERFLLQIPHRLAVAADKRIIFNAVLVDVDTATGKARGIERIYREVDI